MNLIIDGPYLAHKSHCCPRKFKTHNGQDSTMIFTFIRTLNRLIRQFQPTRTTVTWESYGTLQWRKSLYPPYKSNRSPPDPLYLSQLKDIQIYLSSQNISQYNSPGNEADDCIATLATSPSIIYTSDKDLYQLVTPQISLYDGKTLITPTHVLKKFGVPPEQVPTVLAIMGDSVDNIPGLKGYGPKKSAKLAKTLGQHFNTPFTHQEEDIIERNLKLITLNRNCDLIPIKPESKIDIIEKYELESLQR